ncbi:MAG TPA: AraC family transcriptional regulator [Chitinophagaceae bacterium]|nr:AraC family transcriptional regulator [Chitinophagaceae bacterium]
MTQYVLKDECKILQAFPHIVEFAIKKINTVQFDSLKKEALDLLRIYYVIDGRFEWIIEGQRHMVYPGDLAIILPGQSFGGERDLFDVGNVTWLHLKVLQLEQEGKKSMGPWSRLSNSECRRIGTILSLNSCPVLSKVKEAGTMFQNIHYEFLNQEIGYSARINLMIEDLFILIARYLTRQHDSRRDFPQTFMKLEQSLREDLSHQWTLDEMAALVGLGITAFTEKVKSYTGFSPLNYLINIRISEAIKLLKRTDVHITDIALDVGFYSSQHFATTFKKLTGYTPTEFRKKHIPTTE